MKALVTGGAGFVGSHVVDRLRADGLEVVCLDSLDQYVHHGAPDYLRDDVDYCFSDLRSVDFSDPRFDGVQAVVHLAALGGVARAAREPANIVAANAGGTARLAEFASRAPGLTRFVLMSSFSVYGANYAYRCPACEAVLGADRRVEDLEAGRFEVTCACGATAEILAITEDTPPAPLETYGASKYMQELAVKGLDPASLTILRPSSIYGSRLRLEDSESTIIARMAGWIKAGLPPKLFEDGQQIRDWVHVDDVVEAISRLVAGHCAPPVINVCSGLPTTLVEACDLIQEAVGRKCSSEVVGGYRCGDMRHCLGDASRLTALLGRSPRPFSDGISVFAED